MTEGQRAWVSTAPKCSAQVAVIPDQVPTVQRGLVSGLVGRIWTLRRDYPALAEPDEFRQWSEPGTARVVIGNWVESTGPKRATLVSETRVDITDRRARVGLAIVRPLVTTFHSLIGSEAMVVAKQRAEAVG